jgi:phage terminase Nu1 subunit (DNA packaging protein)
MAEVIKTETITQDQVAGILGVTSRRVRQLDKEAYPPPRLPNGTYPCPEFGAWLLEKWRRGTGISEDGKAFDYNAERARLTHHQANTAALDEEVKRRTLLPADEVKTYWQSLFANSRAKLLALPSRLASVCAGGSAAEVETQSRQIIHEALRELAEGGDGVPRD